MKKIKILLCDLANDLNGIDNKSIPLGVGFVAAYFVKLNNNFEGCETVFPRQEWNTKDLPVGHMVTFPGVITHPHYTTRLASGIKYSLVGRVTILSPRENEFDDIAKI
jgi:hypothetical protein|tara:strand:+ start:375 stop:698 length:324 start_codon:yes stop_codon:yes gene_type:complete